MRLNDENARIMDQPTKVLVADDELISRESLKMLLENLDFLVMTAKDGEEAWQVFLQDRPDIVFSDLKMPKLDGFELLSRISTENPEVPIIILSGAGTMDNVLKALRLGAWDYLTKPLADIDALVHIISKNLEKRDLIRLARNYQELFEESVRQRTHDLDEEIKERKKVEFQLLQAKQEWEKTVDSMPDLIALLDHDHKIIRLNHSMATVMGVISAEAIGSTLCLFAHSQNQGELLCPHDLLLADGKIHTSELYHEKTKRFYEVRVIPYSNPGESEVNRSVIHARDITETKKAKEEQQRLQTQLLQAQKLESLGQLASGIAHEINTPTQYVCSNIDFLGEAYEDVADLVAIIEQVTAELPEKTAAKIRAALEGKDWAFLAEEIPLAIDQSKDGVKRISSIVWAMKEFSHPSSKEKEKVNINHLIDTIVTVARNEWKYVANVETILASDLPDVPCVSNEIGQVILNILVNAAQAIGKKLGENPEGQKGVITISTQQDADYAEIAISDTGIGIPQDIVSRVFDPFFTTKQVGEGTGQGLAIARNVVVEKHQGTIEVQSEVDQGARFFIKLPLQA